MKKLKIIFISIKNSIKKDIIGIYKTIKIIKAKKDISFVTLFFDIIWSYLKFNINYKEYSILEFYMIDKLKRNTYIGHENHSLYISFSNRRKKLNIFNNREKFYNKYKIYLNRNVYDIRDLSFKQIEQIIIDNKVIICKNIYLSNESDSLLLDLKNFRSPAFLLECAKNNKLYFFEEVVKENKILRNINFNSNNTISIITYKKGSDVNIVMSYIKIGISDEAIYDVNKNKYITALINLENGSISSNFIDKTNKIYKTHPLTSENLGNLKVPFFDKIKKYAIECALITNDVNEVKWDFVISSKKVHLINASLWNEYVFYQKRQFMKNGLLPFYKKNGNKRII